MVLRKKVAIFDWVWDPNLAHREGQKIPEDPFRFLSYTDFNAQMP